MGVRLDPLELAWVNRQKNESDNAMADVNRDLKAIIVKSVELDQHR